ncbi:MAG TPA: hypothetical protein VF011_11945 [Terriglobales bacterium]
MSTNGRRSIGTNPFYRCAGPNCGVLKGASDRWWVMWTSIEEYKTPVLYLAPWNEELAQTQGALHICGELCAQKLQSHFMDNVLKNSLTRNGRDGETRSSAENKPEPNA